MTATRAIATGAAVLAGAGLAVQARLNGDLAHRIGDGITAALVTTTVGLTVLAVLVPATRPGRRALRRLRDAVGAGHVRWWHFTGGIAGALYVSSQGITVESLGVAVFTVAVVGGTAAGSLAADRWGIGPGGRYPVTAARLAGALACVGAVALAAHDRLTGPGGLVLLPLLAGAAIAVQSAFNGRVGAVARSPWPATLINFAVAAVTLTLAVVVRGVPGNGLPAEPWLYAAGLLGIGGVVAATLIVRYVGVLVFGLASVAGQLVGAVAVDTVTGPRPTVATWLGTAVTLGAVALAARQVQQA